MAQITTGCRAIFSHPLVYNISQRVVGGDRARRDLVERYLPCLRGKRLLDVGCGTAEILRFLPAEVDYVGFDASSTYIENAKRRFGKRGCFHAKMVQEATISEMGKFDVVLAFGLLHHLEDHEARVLFSLASQALREDGALITVDPTYDEGQSRLARWLISRDRGQNVRAPSGYRRLAESFFSDVYVTVRHDLLYIPYSHAILRCGRAVTKQGGNN